MTTSSEAGLDTPSISDCRLCPHACGVDRAAGERGACGAGFVMEVARVALHFWEEPPISGSAGSGTIFFSHCTLGCVYCQNNMISHGGVGSPMSVGGLADACLALERQGAMNVNMVTPTHYAPLVRAGVHEARERGLTLPVVWNTSGYETVEAVRKNVGTVDVYLTDFKYASDGLARAYSHVGDYVEVALAALDAMVEAVGAPAYDDFGGEERIVRGVVVRHLMLPRGLEDSKRVVEMLAARYGSSVRLSLMNQYTPVLRTASAAGDARAARVLEAHPELACKVQDAEYEALLDYADALGVEDYFWQQGGACEESFIPDFASGEGVPRG